MGLCEAEGFCTRENLSVVTVNPGTTTRQFGADILSTIDIKAQEIGRRAVDLIAWRHAHPSAGPVQRVIIPELAAPPAGG
jgi:DNA-binding LacI/PurR family transcriptional regulator